MFAESDFNNDISKWNVSNVEDIGAMFYNSKFNQDISNWNIRQDCDTSNMFYSCPILNERIPKSFRR